MKFYAMTEQTTDQTELVSEYKGAREIGVLRLGENILFFRKMRKVYYIPYSVITRCFRRVLLVPAKMCCGKGDLPVEYLVVCTEQGELAQIQLPGTRAAKIMMEDLKTRIPHASFEAIKSSKEEG